MMTRRMMSGALVAACVVATVAHAEEQVTPEFVQNILIANGDNLNGQFIEVFAGDMMIRSVTRQSVTQNTGPVQLREGAFDRLRLVAEDMVETVPGANPRDIPCQDYGYDVIAIVWGPETRDLVSANCPGNAVLDAQEAFITLLNAERVE